MIVKPSGCRPCPLFSKGKGFCLGWGNPKTAMLALNLETPANNEISHLLDPRDKMDNEEITRRMNAFPNLERKHVNKGIPIVGRSGWLVDQWILRAAGIRRHELFLDNTLRCFPPKGKNDSHYPIGEERKEAERCCSQYNRWDEFFKGVLLCRSCSAKITIDDKALQVLREAISGCHDEAQGDYQRAAREDLDLLETSSEHKAFLLTSLCSTQEEGKASKTPKTLSPVSSVVQGQRIQKAGATLAISKLHSSSLLSSVRRPQNRKESKIQKGDEKTKGSVYMDSPRVQKGSSARTSSSGGRLRLGTPASDGEKARKTASAFGTRASQEREQGGQPSKKSGTGLDGNAQRAGSVPVLSEAILNQIVCPACLEGELHYPEGIAVISMHPASLLRDPSPLSLIVEDFKKMRDFAKQGLKVIGLLGGKSAKQFLKYGETVTRFRGHYQYLGRVT